MCESVLAHEPVPCRLCMWTKVQYSVSVKLQHQSDTWYLLRNASICISRSDLLALQTVPLV